MQVNIHIIITYYYMMKYYWFIVLVLILKLITISAEVVSWGENCNFTAECGDHRLVCEEVPLKNMTPIKICVCDRYHEWNGTLVGCVQKLKTKEILATLTEQYNIAGRIEYEANIVFLAQVIAGLIVLGVGLVCIFVVIVFCYRMWRQDIELEDIVRKLESQNEKKKKSSTSQGKK